MLWRILTPAPCSLTTLHSPPSSLPLIFRSRQRTGCRARAVRAGRDTRTDGGSAAAHRRAAHWSGCLSSQLSLAGNTRTLSHSPWAPQANSHLSQHNQNLQTVFVITWQSPTGDIRPGAGNLFVEETGPTRGTEICHNYHFCLGRLSALLVTQTQLFSLKFIFLGILFTSESDEMKNNIKRITLVLSDWNLQKILLFYLQFCCLLTTK